MAARFAWGAVALVAVARVADAIPKAGERGQWCVGAALGEAEADPAGSARVDGEDDVVGGRVGRPLDVVPRREALRARVDHGVDGGEGQNEER